MRAEFWWFLEEFWPNSDGNDSNDTVPARPNLTSLEHLAAARGSVHEGPVVEAPEATQLPTPQELHEQRHVLAFEQVQHAGAVAVLVEVRVQEVGDELVRRESAS